MDIVGTLGLPELSIICFIVVLILVANKLPPLGDGLRDGISRFVVAMRAEVHCGRCGERLSAGELHCPRCRETTTNGSTLMIALAVAAVIVSMVLLDAQLW